MGNNGSTSKVNFDDMKHAIGNKDYAIISTLPEHRQSCLIEGTIPAMNETVALNEILNRGPSKHVIIYGESAVDDSIVKKYHQITSLGFPKVSIYPGGLFEWLLLQEVYSADEFPTTSIERDILKFKGRSALTTRMLTY